MAEHTTAPEPAEQAPVEVDGSSDMAAEVLRHAQDMTDDIFRHGPEAAGDVKAHVQDMTGDVLHHSRVAAGDVKRETPVLIGHFWETLGDLFGSGKDESEKADASDEASDDGTKD